MNSKMISMTFLVMVQFAPLVLAQNAPPPPTTFHKEIAPILFQHCAPCHRPGQAGPFSLLTYADAKKHAREMVEVTARRYMPPWPPEPGFGEFVGERRLSAGEMDSLRRWFDQGTPEGNSADGPAPPKFSDEWFLGKPDLIVTMPEAYELSADGKDIYRNFVVPIPISQRRFVQGMELRPGNARIVHHAFVLFDRTRTARKLDQADPGPGFSGMNIPGGLEGPEGFFLGWQPGKLPARSPEGLAWPLEPGTDLVLQMHLRPSGKIEPIRASLGFYFTDKAPTNMPSKISLGSYNIDIPAGATNYVVTDSYRLPVDVSVLAIAPHAHYLAREMQVYALLPDGGQKWLLLIRNWDFNWQGDYRYVAPVPLPRGSTVFMKFTYDNSTNNLRNPNHPPRRVTYGVNSSDEMSELWLQVLAGNRADFEKLTSDYQVKALRDITTFNEYRLRLDPRDARAHNQLGQVMLALGKFEAARIHFAAAVQTDPKFDEAHYHLGLALQELFRLDEAKAEYQKAIELNPDNQFAQNNLGVLYYREKNLLEAERYLRNALRLDPQDRAARANLELIEKGKKLSNGGK